MIQPHFYIENRKNIATRMNGALIVLSAYTQLQRRNDEAFYFDQEANFWYFTGVTHPDWLVIIDGSSGDEWLVAPTIEPVHQVFDGSLSLEDASRISGVKKVITQDEAAVLFQALAKKHSVVYTIDKPPYAHMFDFSLNPAITDNKRMLERIFNSVIDCQKEIATLRAIKQPEEIKAIQAAINVTIQGFETVKQKLSDMRYEYEIEAEFSYIFKRARAARHAYDPIVASGHNACTLHYIKNNTVAKANNLVLMDVGARVDGYCADITRTYARDEISVRKQSVHAAVVDAHRQIIALLKPHLSLEEYSKQVDHIMKEALMSLGILADRSDNETYRRYFPHAISHGLGIDTHDSLGSPRYFEPGMVVTVEPGIYIPEEGIGVRIEDDVLVTPSGNKNLSAKLSTDY